MKVTAEVGICPIIVLASCVSIISFVFTISSISTTTRCIVTRLLIVRIRKSLFSSQVNLCRFDGGDFGSLSFVFMVLRHTLPGYSEEIGQKLMIIDNARGQKTFRMAPERKTNFAITANESEPKITFIEAA